MAEYLDKNGLEDVASKVNSRLKTVTTMPASASDGAVRLYVGASGQTYIKGHVYQYSQSGSEWQDITPASGGGSSNYLDLSNKPSINGKVLVPNSDGHTYRLVNADDLGGFTETCEQNTSLPTTYTVISFIEFNGKLYAGTTGHGIYVSTDGNTFTPNTSLPASANVFAFIEFNGKLYAGGSSIYVSSDGDTFQSTSFSVWTSVYALIEFHGKLYVGTAGHGLYVSTDGNTFTQNASFPTSAVVSAFIEFNGKLYAGARGIYTSTDGDTFTQNASFPTATNYTVRAFIEFNGKLYAGAPNHGIYTSTDGDTFTQNTLFPTNYSVRAFIEFNGKLYAGTQQGIYVSADGDTFTQNTLFPTNYTGGALTEFNGKLYAGTNNGIYIFSLILDTDSVPTANSQKLVRSGGIYNALASKINRGTNFTAGHLICFAEGGDLLDSEISVTSVLGGILYRTPRWLRFSQSDRKSLVIKAGTVILVGNYIYEAATDQTYSMGTLEAGKDYFVYLNLSNGSWTVTCSQTKSADTSTSRCIGRFHTLCASVPAGTTMILPDSPGGGRSAGGNILVKSYRQDSDPDFYAFYNKTISSVESGTYYDVVTCEHPLAGFSAGDILPESVWCLNWKPDTLHEDAMVYDKDTGIAVDVYLQSGTGLNTKSVYEAAHTVSRQQWNHQGDMLAVGKKLLRDYEFSSAALGSNECTNIAGSVDAGTVGGHSDSNNRRMISAIGCEEMCGYLWQWLDEVNGKPDENEWTVTDGQGAFGQEYWQPRALLAGGRWGDGTLCGSRCRAADGGRAGVDAAIGGRGSSRVVRGA